jgi:hypothetical protein
MPAASNVDSRGIAQACQRNCTGARVFQYRPGKCLPFVQKFLLWVIIVEASKGSSWMMLKK